MVHSIQIQKKQFFSGKCSGRSGTDVFISRDISKVCRRFFLFSLALFIFSVLFYLFGSNSIAAKGHEMRAVESKITVVRDEYKKLKIEEAELKSPYSLEHDDFGLETIQPSEVSYIQEKGSVAYSK